MCDMKILTLLIACLLTATTAVAQTPKFLPGDTLMIPAGTKVDLIGEDDFVTSDTLLAVLIGERYPFWYIDLNLANDVADSARVGNSFLLGSEIVNRSSRSRELGLEDTRKLARVGVDLRKIGGNIEKAMADLVAQGVPVLLKFSFDVNDEGGVEPKVHVYNISDARIRSMDIDFRGLDESGKPVHCTRSGKSHYTVKMKGPIDPDAECYFAFVNDPAFFNEATQCLEIDSVKVEFMDGSQLVMDEDLTAIQELLKSPFMRRGECPGS